MPILRSFQAIRGGFRAGWTPKKITLTLAKLRAQPPNAAVSAAKDTDLQSPHGRLVTDKPTTEADQDRCSRRPSCPRDHLPFGRGGPHRRDGTRHPLCHPLLASTTDMCMTAINAQTEGKRQTGLSAALKTPPLGKDRVALRSDPPRAINLPDRGRCLARKRLVKRLDSGERDVERHVAWGMSKDPNETSI
jgi:hypothetical protein